MKTPIMLNRTPISRVSFPYGHPLLSLSLSLLASRLCFVLHFASVGQTISRNMTVHKVSEMLEKATGSKPSKELDNSLDLDISSNAIMSRT